MHQLATHSSIDLNPHGSPLGLIDGCGRRIDHLRMSVTSACDLRCRYCRPQADRAPSESSAGLTDGQRLDLATFLAETYGLKQVRLTGGEPLLYRNILSLVSLLRSALPQVSLVMTTNGRRLEKMASDLRRAGLDRLNISLDSLNPQSYQSLTGAPLDKVLAGLDAAVAAGFPPPKINTVALRSINDDQIVELTQWALARGSEIRFLEAMPIGPAADFNRKCFLPVSTIRQGLEREFNLSPIQRDAGETAARFWATRGSLTGVVGFITPVTSPFCGSCRRIRVTEDGKLYPCLLDDRRVDLRHAWSESGLNMVMVDRLIRDAVMQKQPRGVSQSTGMINLGG